MASLMNTFKLVQKLTANNPAVLRQAARSMAGWNKDYKAGKFPQSDAEREAAAKKYFLLPEEYKPYADNGLGYGDYPQLKGGLGIEARDPFYPYDFPELKRNLHETFHAESDLYSEDRWSQPAPPRYANSTYWLGFLGCMAGCLALYYWLENYRMYRPVAVKQYPGDGRKHYTFETN
ncbi:NADH dehydrogenase [ubiquinone] 1 beta subcomplex subunit 8, mitochondrial [Musca vetustissima]|uniref:NADH dehydrogenase [ubiquinone] 1 beta subcomplex subunit 8, mitochondrial n=1 Tax=Musca vetustissima TaxID=27455 RepID=UPI002AB71B81|nr:NADH dehydrogenase [ubiquinone] 1 beta subcomplex subunit 8, mitochondrial [Musca vetustissima]